METLDLEFSDRHALAEAHSVNGDRIAISVAGEPPYATGTTARVRLKIVDSRRTFQLDCRVTWTRFARNKAGYGLELLDDQSGIRDRLLGFLRGEVPVDAIRLNERVKTRLSLKIPGTANSSTKVALDLSAGGLFAAMPVGELPAKGSEVTLAVRPPLSLIPLRLKGRVAWHRPAGRERGVGVEFLFGSAAERERIEKLVLRIRKKRRGS